MDMEDEKFRVFGDGLAAAMVGCWKIDIDEGKEPRMYADATMLHLIGLEEDSKLSPEELYHAWYDNVDSTHYSALAEGMAYMMKGELTEIQYPWHHPDGRTFVFRCCGVRDKSYTAGARVAGIHQWVNTMKHVDRVLEEQQKRLDCSLKALEASNRHEQFRADALNYVMRNEDLEGFIDYFSEHALELYGCDQVIYRDIEGRQIVKERPGIKPLDFSLCANCRHYEFDSPVYSDGYTVMDDCRVGYKGISVHSDCRVRASLTWLVHEEDKVFGYIALHYLDGTHHFTEDEKNTFDRLAKMLSLVVSRRKQQKAIRESLVFTNYFIDTFVSTYSVNLETHECKVFKRTEKLAKNYPFISDYVEAIGNYIDRDVHPDDRSALKEFIQPENLKRLLKEHKTVTHGFRDISDGVEKNYGVRIVRGVDENTAAFAFADLTEETKKEQMQQKMLEMALEASERANRRNETLNKIIKSGTWSFYFNSDNKIIRTNVSPECNAVIRNNIGDVNVWMTLIHPDDSERVIKAFNDTLQDKTNNTPYDVEYRIRSMSGEYVWIHSAGLAIRNADGSGELYGICVDISEAVMHRNEEQKLRYLQTFGSMLNAAIWSMEIKGDEIASVVWSDELRHMFGFCNEEDFPNSLNAWTERLHPADSEKVLKNCMDAIRNRKEDIIHNVEYRIRNKTGEYRWYHAFGRIENRENEYRTYYGIVVDITTEKALELRNARFDIVKSLIKAGLWNFKLNASDEVVDAEYSGDMAKFLNVTDNLKELGPNVWMDLVHPDDREAASTAFRATIGDHSGKTPYDVIYRMVDKYGNYSWFHSAGSIIRFDDGSGDFFGIQINITKTIEKEREQQAQLEEALAKEIARARDEKSYQLAILNNAYSYFRINLTQNKIIPPIIEKIDGQPVDYTGKFPQPLPSYEEVIALGAKNYVDESYKESYRDSLNCEYLIKCFNEGNMMPVYVCRIYSTKIGWHYRRYITYLSKDEVSGDICGMTVAYDITKEFEAAEREKKYKKELEEAYIKVNDANLRNELLYDISKAIKWSYLINQDDKIVSYNYADQAEKLVFSDNFDNPMTWTAILHPEDREKAINAFNAVVHDHSGKTPYEVTYRIKGVDREYVWLKVSGRIICRNDGMRELFGISVDVTDQMEKEREQQNELKEALSMAQSANRAKTTFLNSMSHDIRTPMNAIIGFTGLAASHLDNKELVQDYLMKIGQSSDHLLSLINDVLDMSRIESGKMNLDEKPENLPDIIHTLHDIVLADIHQKQHDFFIDTVNVNDENIICDKLRLNQILLNILSNAIKYTAQGGTISMRITETTIKPSGYATYEFCIKDNGMGMDKEYLKTIFDPFTRVKSSTVSGIQGTGLGMAITKNIIDMMGGKIDVKSELGKGTQMTVTFDFKLQDAHRDAITIEELKGLRALVADDDANTCVSIYGMLKEIGMRSEWCTTGKEAVFRAETAYREGDLFKVYIIDWLMPDMNGIEATRRIRKAIGDDVPIIILTAYDWSDIEDEAREAGVTAFVSKPMFPSDLHRVLNNCLGKQEALPDNQDDGFDFTGKKILLVEDNELNREIAVELLTEYGCIIDTAEDGTIAVEKMKSANEGDYDVILMDIQMPVMNGYQATKEIRAMGTQISKIPILAMTADAFEEDRKHALDAGMNDHITKPINIALLRKTLAKYL